MPCLPATSNELTMSASPAITDSANSGRGNPPVLMTTRCRRFAVRSFTASCRVPDAALGT